MPPSAKSEEALLRAAKAWVGTPWCDNSGVRGRGACCHKLAAAIYSDAGWLHLNPPDGVATAARWANRSPILDWLRDDGFEYFEELQPTQDLRPGDLMLIKVGHVAHHLALLLPGNQAVHVTHQHGVQIVPILPVWRRLLAHVFRPR